MKYIQATIILGLFGWLSYAVWVGTFFGEDGGSSKTRALKGLVGAATDRFGTETTAIGLAVVGLLLTAFMLMRSEDA